MSFNLKDAEEQGVRVIRYATGSVKWRGDCDYCVRLATRDDRPVDPATGFFPDHEAMRGCRSGGNNHCTCDGCF